MSDYSADHKFPAYQIVERRNADPDFYTLLGPLLSRREVAASLGGPVWDDPGKSWLVAVADIDSEVLGMVGIKGREITSFYVKPDHRGQLVGTALVTQLLARFPERPLRLTATVGGRALFQSFGFVDTGRRGHYYTMTLGTS